MGQVVLRGGQWLQYMSAVSLNHYGRELCRLYLPHSLQAMRREELYYENYAMTNIHSGRIKNIDLIPIFRRVAINPSPRRHTPNLK